MSLKMNQMMKKWIGFVTGILLSIQLLGQGYESRVAMQDILHYTFDLTISDLSDQIQGKALIEVELKQASNQILLDLVGLDDKGKGMKVLGVTEESAGSLGFDHQGELLKINLKDKASPGTRLRITVAYEGIPADGLIISNDQRDGRSFFGDNWPNRAHHWLPTVDHPSEKALVDFIIHAPAHYEIVANGLLVDQRVAPDGIQTSHWENKEPLPTKVMVFGAADFAIQDVGYLNDIKVSSWVFEKDEKSGFQDYAQGKDILAWFIERVGAYPWEKLANVQSRTRYGGMENASCIFYADNSVTGDGSCEALMAHEIAHQWFGNSATEANWYHIWLSEGFATYFTHLYFEAVHGDSEFRTRLIDDRKLVVNWAPAQYHSVVDPSIKDINQLLSPNSYQKGGWILHMLRRKIGDEAFFQGIRAYYADFKFGNALSEDLQKEMETVSGQNLNGFFQQWLYRPGFPTLDVVWSYKKSKKLISLSINQTQSGPAYAFPLELKTVDTDGITTGRWVVEMDKKSQKVSFNVPEYPAKVILDPNVNLLFQGKAVRK